MSTTKAKFIARICRKGFIRSLLPAALMLAAGAANSSATSQRPAEVLCRVGLDWYVDYVDPRFGLSVGEVGEAAATAAEMWNEAAGRPLFAQSAGDHGISIRLLYDHRQELQDQLNVAEQGIDRLRQQIALMDSELADERQQLQTSQSELETLSEQINTDNSRINEIIAQNSNRRGQVSADVARQVSRMQAEVQSAIDSYNEQVEELNQTQAEFNTKVELRNRVAEQQSALISQRNAKVRNNRNEWARAGLESNAGLHTIQTRTRRNTTSVHDERISIFSVNNEQALVAVLAHELGHAIGLSHVDGRYSIMSANLEQVEAGVYPQYLTEQDTKALQNLCD